MKITPHIADDLLEEARLMAARDAVTLRALVEEGLQRVLTERHSAAQPFTLKQVCFGHGGLRPEVTHLSPHDLIYFSCCAGID